MSISSAEQEPLDRIIAAIAEIKNVDRARIAGDTLLFSEDHSEWSLDFDSLDGIELSIALEQTFGIDESVDLDFRTLRTVRSIADYVESSLRAAP